MIERQTVVVRDDHPLFRKGAEAGSVAGRVVAGPGLRSL